MRAGSAKVGDKVCIKGYELLTFEIVAVSKRASFAVKVRHPMTGAIMSFAWVELTPAPTGAV